jgi:hypothetical protein
MKRFLILFILVTCLYLSGKSVQDERNVKWNFSVSAGSSFSLKNPGLPGPLNGIFLRGLVSTFFEVDRKIMPNLSIGLTSGTSMFSKSSFFSSPVDTRIEIKEISPVIQYNFRNMVLIGAGPVFYDLVFPSELNKAGFIVKSTFKYPLKSRVYAKIDTQYRHSGIIDRIFELYGHKSFYYDNVNTNHFYLGFGLGLRL